MRRMSALPVLVLLSLFYVSCNTTDNVISDYKTYHSIYYTINYPSHWQEPELFEGIHGSQVLWEEDNRFSLRLSATRILTDTYIEEDDILKKLENIDFEMKDCIIDGQTAFRVRIEDNGEILTSYLVQKKDVFFELILICQADDHNSQALLELLIEKSFKFNDFEALCELKNNWNKYSLENLEVYYPDNSMIYDSIENWAEIRVEAFNYIAEYLGVHWEYKPIEIFVFNSKQHGKEYGLALGFAKVDYNKIYLEYVQTPGHELAHCISYYINNGQRIDSTLINEGLATYLNMTGTDYHEVAADLLQEKDYIISLLGNDFMKNEYAYSLGASFTGYLIEEYGLELFISFFAQNEHNEEESFMEFYDKQGSILVQQWLEYLKIY